VARNNPSFSL